MDRSFSTQRESYVGGLVKAFERKAAYSLSRNLPEIMSRVSQLTSIETDMAQAETGLLEEMSASARQAMIELS